MALKKVINETKSDKISNLSSNSVSLTNESSIKSQTAKEWLEEIQQVPFFMQHFDKTKENTSLDAIIALQYEGEPLEIAKNFKFNGDECYKNKKYRDAVEYYTKALNINACDNIETVCLLNRAACHLKLENFRQTLTDCNKVLKKEPNHIKAIYRSAKACFFLDRLDESLDYINHCLKIDCSNNAFNLLKEMILDRKEYLNKKIKETHERKNLSLIKKKTLHKALKERGIIIKSSSVEPELDGAELCLSSPFDIRSALLFPMIFLYPLVLQSDFIKQVSETSIIQEQLDLVLTSAPEWDKDAEYRPLNVEVYIETRTKEVIYVNKNAQLLDILKDERIEVLDGIVQFLILPKNKVNSWINQWKIKKDS